MDSTSADRRVFDETLGPDEAAGKPRARLVSPETLAPQQPETSVQPQRSRKRLIAGAALLLVLAAAGHYGWRWWTVGRFQESTDNAFLQSDKVTIASKAAGFLATVQVRDNQPVKAGDMLATIDDRDYKNALIEAQADLAKAEAQFEGFKAAVIQQQAQVESAKADVASAEAGLTFAEQEARRSGDLLVRGSGTSQHVEQTQSDLAQRRATLAKNRATLDAAQKQITTFLALARSAEAGIDGAKAKLDQAQLNLGYTIIRAPVDGVVGDRSLRVGQLVQAGTGLLTVVPTGRDLYLVANFKETQLAQMRPGQKVEFTVDAFGDHLFQGVVDSFAPGTGAQFALLPPENATGNFTKIVQRVPVKIALLGDDLLLPLLRPGLSVEAIVETRGKAD